MRKPRCRGGLGSAHDGRPREGNGQSENERLGGDVMKCDDGRAGKGERGYKNWKRRRRAAGTKAPGVVAENCEATLKRTRRQLHSITVSQRQQGRSAEVTDFDFHRAGVSQRRKNVSDEADALLHSHASLLLLPVHGRRGHRESTRDNRGAQTRGDVWVRGPQAQALMEGPGPAAADGWLVGGPGQRHSY
ncbi:hypothetical protein GN956_G13192 [Arapaima gigas]